MRCSLALMRRQVAEAKSQLRVGFPGFSSTSGRSAVQIFERRLSGRQDGAHDLDGLDVWNGVSPPPVAAAEGLVLIRG